MSGKLETIKTSITMLDTGLKGPTFLQMQSKAKIKTGNNSDSSTNTKTMATETQHELSPPLQPPLSSRSPPPKPSLTSAQQNTLNPKDTDILDKGKGHLYIEWIPIERSLILRSP